MPTSDKRNTNFNLFGSQRNVQQRIGPSQSQISSNVKNDLEQFLKYVAAVTPLLQIDNEQTAKINGAISQMEPQRTRLARMSSL
jgi:hypothetical protein